MESFGVSRMTAHRALRELAADGSIVRIKGRGSFVAPRKRSATVMGVRNIADEIYEALDREYDHLTEDEQVWESLLANDIDVEPEGDEDDEEVRHAV